MPSDVIQVLLSLVHLVIIILIIQYSCIGVLLRSVWYRENGVLSSLCIVSLMCSSFTARVFVWCSFFLRFLNSTFYITEHYGDLEIFMKACGSLRTKMHSEWMGHS
jgi:hypothetical protein